MDYGKMFGRISTPPPRNPREGEKERQRERKKAYEEQLKKLEAKARLKSLKKNGMGAD